MLASILRQITSRTRCHSTGTAFSSDPSLAATQAITNAFQFHCIFSWKFSDEMLMNLTILPESPMYYIAHNIVRLSCGWAFRFHPVFPYENASGISFRSDFDPAGTPAFSFQSLADEPARIRLVWILVCEGHLAGNVGRRYRFREYCVRPPFSIPFSSSVCVYFFIRFLPSPSVSWRSLIFISNATS